MRKKKNIKDMEILQLVVGGKTNLDCLRKKHNRIKIKNIQVCLNCTEKSEMVFLVNELILGTKVKHKDKLKDNFLPFLKKSKEQLLEFREALREINRQYVFEAIKNKTEWEDSKINEKLEKAKKRLAKG